MTDPAGYDPWALQVAWDTTGQGQVANTASPVSNRPGNGIKQELQGPIVNGANPTERRFHGYDRPISLYRLGEKPIQSCGQSGSAPHGTAGASLHAHTELRAKHQRSAREAIYRIRPIKEAPGFRPGLRQSGSEAYPNP